MITKEREETPVLDVYLTDFGLTEADLTGKRILDLGAGPRQFAFESLTAGIKTRGVWSLDGRYPWMATLRMIEMGRLMRANSPVLNQWSEVGKKSVEGTMERLPFGDGSFDLILSRDALTHVFDSALPMANALLEVVRVLAVGGEALIFPGWLDNWKNEEKERVKDALGALAGLAGVSAELVEIERQFAGRMVNGVMMVLRKSGDIIPI